VQKEELNGYKATPDGKARGGVLVLHAWWGLNDATKSFCSRLARSGFVAFAPDLYHGKVTDTIAGAEELRDALDADRAKTEIVQAAQFMVERTAPKENGLAVIGFSLGAYFALDLSVTHPQLVNSVVVFYGTGPRDFSSSKASYLGHFAASDQFEPQSEVDALEEALRSAGRPADFYKYPGTGHWFFEPDRKDAYNEAEANLAWDRTIKFLKYRASE